MTQVQRKHATCGANDTPSERKAPRQPRGPTVPPRSAMKQDLQDMRRPWAKRLRRRSPAPCNAPRPLPRPTLPQSHAKLAHRGRAPARALVRDVVEEAQGEEVAVLVVRVLPQAYGRARASGSGSAKESRLAPPSAPTTRVLPSNELGASPSRLSDGALQTSREVSSGLAGSPCASRLAEISGVLARSRLVSRSRGV